VTTSPAEIQVTLLLCDAAQSIGGKLYILGGGWTQAVLVGQPIPMALAVRFLIPWERANHRFEIRVALVDSEGSPVDLGEGPIEALTELEVGRPPGVKPGSPLDATLALTAGALPLEAGAYVWVLEADGTERARAPFVLRSAAG
jgi:hypothetical protein